MIDYRYDDGGREAAGYRGKTGDCVVRAIAICTGEDYRAVYLTMAEHMKRNGYAASGNAYATRERNRKAPRRKGQIAARRVQDRVLEVYGFQKVRLPAGARPTFTEAPPPLRRLHRRHHEARGCHRGRRTPRHIRRPHLRVGQALDGVRRRDARAQGSVRLGAAPGDSRVSKKGDTT